MRTVSAIIAIALSVTSCAQTGRVVDGDGEVYSEYIQCLVYAENRAFSFDALETLGSERLPDDYEFSSRDRDFLKSPDTIAAVTEVYVRNHTDSVLKISLGEIRKNSRRVPLGNVQFDVPPNDWVKTDPIVRASSVYQPDTHTCEIDFIADEEPQTITGVWRRLKVSELKRQGNAPTG